MAKKSGSKGDPSKREIKQVYITEDGSEETSVTAVVEKRKTKGEEGENHRDKISGATKTLRIVAVAVAMFFSLMLAMMVGVGLALWDSNRTIADLSAAITGAPVQAATYDQVPGDGNPDAEALTTINDDNAAVVSDTQEESSGDATDGADYGETIESDEAGLSKADEDDEIVSPDESEGPQALKDPLEDYPRPFTKVDESYFKDALFIGDSRLQGFGFWSGLPATYYCATGFHIYKYETTKVVQTENGKVPIFDAMPYDAFTKIYIKVGLNELGYGTEENFEQTYAQLIAKLREYEPRAIIYVHAILPVTAKKSETDKAHNNPNIVKRNEALKEFAKSQKAYFIDAGPVLSDEEGNLKPEMTSDGIHLKPEYMKIWREFLCENAVN